MGCSPWGWKELDMTEVTKHMYGKMQASRGVPEIVLSHASQLLGASILYFHIHGEWLQSDGC